MSPGPGPIDTAGKKRRRKRSKKSQNGTVELEQPFPENKANKKLKFDDLDAPQEPPKENHEAKELAEKPQEELPQEVKQIQEKPKPKEEPKRETRAPKPQNNNNRGPKKAVFFDEDDDEEDSHFNVASKAPLHVLKEKAQQLLSSREKLPIYRHKDKIIDYVLRNQVTVIIGETGSGKSTQIPQFLMPLNKKRVAVTQPRRVAAASLAARVSEEYGCRLGSEVGYQVRFSNITSQNTQLNYLTDGMLIREFMLDDKLSKYSTIIIDEAHERTVLTDIIMGFLKQLIITGKRKDLKIIVMSATLNADLFSRFFDRAPILYVEGKMYPVQKLYLSDTSEDIVDTMVKTIVQVNMAEEEGDLLCFLPGQEDIDNCVNILNTLAPQLPKEAPLIVAVPLYAALSPAQQLKVFERLKGKKRKVICATNIAETSVTVSGVKYVIDSGLRKVKVWKHQLGLSTLLTTPISQASAKQRAGRAGRESEGKVFRLYSENLFLNKLPKQQESEIMRNDIVLPVLTLKRMGVDDLLNWTWLEHPGQEAILSALNTLYALGALNDSGKVTQTGYKMAVLPLPPALSAVLISALQYSVLQEVVDIVSCLSVDNLLLNVGGNGELRDEINHKRRQYCPLGTKSGDLISLKEYFDYFHKLHQDGNIAELKAWCKELFLSYKGFKSVLQVRKQLTDYLVSMAKQDESLLQHERDSQLKNVRAQLNLNQDLEDEESLKPPMVIPNVLKAFMRGFATNTAIGMPDRSFRTCAAGQLISIHPSSVLFGKSNLDAIMYIEYVYTAKPYARTCSVIELSWLQEVAPQLLGTTKISVADQ